MFSFDPSTTNIISIVAVVALFVFFIILLMKLHPSTETKENLETEIEVVEQKPPQISKSEDKAVPAKTSSVSSKRGCIHHFGYLGTFPKNSPIPDECFGCEKIVECLVKPKSR